MPLPRGGIWEIDLRSALNSTPGWSHEQDGPAAARVVLSSSTPPRRLSCCSHAGIPILSVTCCLSSPTDASLGGQERVRDALHFLVYFTSWGEESLRKGSRLSMTTMHDGPLASNTVTPTSISTPIDDPPRSLSANPSPNSPPRLNVATAELCHRRS